MNHTMTDIVDHLYQIPKFTTKNSLDHTRELMKRLGDPAGQLKVIHVAGSNGKGSVCSFLYHMFLYGGKNTGLFTSPHLVDVRERFQINGRLCSQEAFISAYEKVSACAEGMQADGLAHPTFFEFIYAMGMVIFAEAGVEYVITETGLGGRLDATNSFDHPLLSIITSISLEHTEILGDSIEQIAAEKAGIIKDGVPVVFDATNEEAAQVIAAIAKEKNSEIYPVFRKMYKIREIHKNCIDFSRNNIYDRNEEWRLPFAAAYQVTNASVALTAIEVLKGLDPDLALSKEAMKEGLLQTRWPGRMQEVAEDIYFDGAHNTSGIETFLESVKTIVKEDKEAPLLLFSMVKEKDYHTSIKMLTGERIWQEMAVTTIPNQRGIPYEELQREFLQDTDRPVSGFSDYRQAFETMCKRRKTGQKLFCTGSLYFIGALMELLQEAE